jgi:hypothetical protein
VLLGFSLVLVAGCGNSRTPVTSATQPSAPDGFETLTRPYAGVRFAVPRNWTVTGQRAPLVVTVASGTATVALWRFARAAPAPAGSRALAGARVRLIAAARARDRTLRLLGSRLARIDGAGAVELDALETIRGRPRRVSSTHLYVPGAELVLDEYAPPDRFAAVERSVFVPVRRSLALLGGGGA